MITHDNTKTGRSHLNKEIKTKANATIAEDVSKTALVIGAGAPNSALMAGALAAFEDENITFDAVSTAGAGGLMGLLWLAPKDKSPQDALRNWVNSYVSDPIYSCFPVDYKIFFKPGKSAQLYREKLSALRFVQATTDQTNQAGFVRLWNDWLQLIWATLSPTSLNANDVGLCARVPWVEKQVDFDRIKTIKPYFYLNAYNITNATTDNFSKDIITADHFRASLAFPFIYGPYEMNGCDYYEGAVRHCLNFHDLTEKHTGLETIVVFDVLGADNLIRKPRDLYDSWVLSMIIPLVSVAENDLELFALKYNNGWKRSEGAKADILRMTFDVPEDQMDKVLDWSHSNGQKLFDIGYQSALRFLNGEGRVLK